MTDEMKYCDCEKPNPAFRWTGRGYETVCYECGKLWGWEAAYKSQQLDGSMRWAVEWARRQTATNGA